MAEPFADKKRQGIYTEFCDELPIEFLSDDEW